MHKILRLSIIQYCRDDKVRQQNWNYFARFNKPILDLIMWLTPSYYNTMLCESGWRTQQLQCTVQYVCTVYSRLCVVSVLSIYSTELLIAELLWLWSWWWWWCEGKSCSELSTENLYYSNWNKKQFLRIKMYWHILYYSRMTEMYALFELNM